jgi:NADPH:quinone reductase-like Zn-dependent oxidoreductase
MDQDRRLDHRPHLPILLTHLRTGALASGGVGTFAVQIARHPGAQVPGVCSTPDVDVVRQLGAGHVIDYTKQDFTFGAAARYDLAFRRDGVTQPGRGGRSRL